MQAGFIRYRILLKIDYFPSFEEIENFCLDKCQKGDVLITMGAGNVVNIGENLLNR